jgi:hypothetical protein
MRATSSACVAAARHPGTSGECPHAAVSDVGGPNGKKRGQTGQTWVKHIFRLPIPMSRTPAPAHTLDRHAAVLVSPPPARYRTRMSTTMDMLERSYPEAESLPQTTSTTSASANYDGCWAASTCGCDWQWGASPAPPNVVVDDRLAANPINRRDPSGLRILVYPSTQTPNAGPVVAAALQSIVGKAAEIYAEPHTRTVQDYDYYGGAPITGIGVRVPRGAPYEVTEYWDIKYRKPNATGPRCTVAWDLLKKAIDDKHILWVNLVDTDPYTKQKLGPDYLKNTNNGYGTTYPKGHPDPSPRDGEVFVDYTGLKNNQNPQKGEIVPVVIDPFEMVLWHELIGHGGLIQGGIEDRHPKNKTLLYDPALKIENIGRDAYNEANGLTPSDMNKYLGERNHLYY